VRPALPERRHDGGQADGSGGQNRNRGLCPGGRRSRRRTAEGQGEEAGARQEGGTPPPVRTVVLGAGVIGVATAYFLTRAGNEVTVIERQPGAGLETSFANGGLVTPGQAGPWGA